MSDHISDLRAVLMEQLRTLRSADLASLPEEIRRAKAVAEVAQTIINSAKVEVDYIAAIKGGAESPFIEAREMEPAPPPIPTYPQSPLPVADDVARCGGPSASHPWRGQVTRHRI